MLVHHVADRAGYCPKPWKAKTPAATQVNLIRPRYAIGEGQPARVGEASICRPATSDGNDGFLRVYYEKLGLKFRSYDDWLAGGARIPTEVTP